MKVKLPEGMSEKPSVKKMTPEQEAKIAARLKATQEEIAARGKRG